MTKVVYSVRIVRTQYVVQGHDGEEVILYKVPLQKGCIPDIDIRMIAQLAGHIRTMYKGELGIVIKSILFVELEQ